LLDHIELSKKQREMLEQLANSRTKEYRLVQRARMIIELESGANHKEVARRSKSNRHTVRLWKRRWLEASQRLKEAEQKGVEQRLLGKMIEAILSDEYRSGTPPTFTPEQIVHIVAISCEKPEDSGRPISHWTPRELAEEAIKRKIVDSISTRSAGRFLKGDGTTATPSRILAKRQA
jgi:putative transposase